MLLATEQCSTSRAMAKDAMRLSRNLWNSSKRLWGASEVQVRETVSNLQRALLLRTAEGLSS